MISDEKLCILEKTGSADVQELVAELRVARAVVDAAIQRSNHCVSLGGNHDGYGLLAQQCIGCGINKALDAYRQAQKGEGGR